MTISCQVQAFRTIKTTLEFRPVYHRLERRIRAHTLLCWLSLLLVRVVEAVTVFAAEFRPDLPGKWGERLERSSALADLRSILDELSKAALG